LDALSGTRWVGTDLAKARGEESGFSTDLSTINDGAGAAEDVATAIRSAWRWLTSSPAAKPTWRASDMANIRGRLARTNFTLPIIKPMSGEKRSEFVVITTGATNEFH